MSLEVTVVSRSRQIYHGHASYVSAPSVEGEVGILTGRQPLLAAMKAGTVHITPEGETEQAEIEVSSGFISVDRDQVMIVVDAF